MVGKLRPNVIILAGLAAILVLIFGYMLIGKLEVQGDEATLAVTAILSMIVGIGIGGLMAIAGQVATDPPPPTVPASTHEAMMGKALDKEGD